MELAQVTSGFLALLVLMGFAAWTYAVAEFIGLWRLSSWAFGRGLIVVRESVHTGFGPAQIGHHFSGARAKASRTSGGMIVFRGFFNPLFQTPFPIKGRIEVSEIGVNVVGRIPVGTSLFIAIWLAGWTAIGAVVPAAEIMNPLTFIAIGWGAVALMLGVSLPWELRKFRLAKEELLGVNG